MSGGAEDVKTSEMAKQIEVDNNDGDGAGHGHSHGDDGGYRAHLFDFEFIILIASSELNRFCYRTLVIQRPQHGHRLMGGPLLAAKD
ncbi:hypothetical protein MY4038_005693 [Beauveria bassiana]